MNPTWNTKSQQKIDKSNEEIKKWIEEQGNRSLDEINDDIRNCTDPEEMDRKWIGCMRKWKFIEG